MLCSADKVPRQIGAVEARTGKVAALFRRSFHHGGIAPLAVFALLLVVMLAGQRAAAAPFAAVVMDARSGEILHSVNDRTRLHPASLTKMMTLYIAFEAVQNGEIGLDDRVTVSRRAASEVPSRLGLSTGQRIALRHLIRGAALRSGNDAATAIAEAISGSVEAFAERMTRTGVAIGMTQTTFRNAHGLTQSGHLSTARDMAVLSRQLYFDYPQYYNLFSRRSEHAGVGHIRNTNWRFLDGYRGADGIKTGYTRAAGYNLAASAQRGDRHVIVTVFGGRSTIDRHNRIIELMDRGFRQAPAQVAVRRPPRPDYSRTQPVVVAEGTGSTGQSAARIVRMQTAPSRSPLPQRRPDADAPDLPEALIASLQSGIGAALAAAAAPETENEPPAIGSSDAAAPEAGAALQAGLAVAPDSAPPPPPRPATTATEIAEALADDLSEAAAVATAEAAGFNVIDADTFDALARTEAPDSDAVATDADPEGPETLAPEALAAVTPEPRPAALAAVAPEETAEALVAEATDELLPEATDPVARASLAAPSSAPAAAAMPEQVAAAQILWRDETPLAEVASRAATATEGLIVLTTSEGANADDVALAGRSALPEVVTRVSTSGGRVWSIDLGLHPSRFDAERVAIRAAMAETAILSTGLRRVSARAGRFAAGIHSLTEDEAQIACLRLAARGHACEVVHP